MENKSSVSVFWFRRDLRLEDNAGFYHALKSGRPVLPVFIFDKAILDKLDDKDDARVTFIHETIEGMEKELQKYGSSILVLYDIAEEAWKKLVEDYNICEVFTNHDYEPYATARDNAVSKLFKKHNIEFRTFKDQVIFEKGEVLKDDGKPYTVFTPYSRKWHEKLTPFYLKAYPVKKYLTNLLQTKSFKLPSLTEMGFEKSSQEFPKMAYKDIIDDYAEKRNYPAMKGTSFMGLHLRFGTVSIRELATVANSAKDKTWLNELVWREFYMMVLYYFPETHDHAFKPDYDKIRWINDEKQFEAWCKGETGYPLVDAGMRELNKTGYMHNRVRMVVASFLSKDLLIDWRWGERYFARKLLDYEMSSNVGGWQWAAGCGTDAAPYFRIFNPEAQQKKFDAHLEYVKKWIPEYGVSDKYPKPIVDHTFARERCLKEFKRALSA